VRKEISPRSWVLVRILSRSTKLQTTKGRRRIYSRLTPSKWVGICLGGEVLQRTRRVQQNTQVTYIVSRGDVNRFVRSRGRKTTTANPINNHIPQTGPARFVGGAGAGENCAQIGKMSAIAGTNGRTIWRPKWKSARCSR